MSSINIFMDHQERSRILSGERLTRNYYSDHISIGVQLPSRSVAVICVEEQAIAVGAFRCGKQATSFHRKYLVSDIGRLDHPIPLARVQDALAAQVKSHFAPAVSRKMALPDGTSREVERVLSALSANASELIWRASGSLSDSDRISESRRQLLVEEKGAFGLVSELGGLGREPGSRGRKLMVPAEEVNPSRTYLESVHESLLLEANDEDALIVGDMKRFDGILGQQAGRHARGMVIPHPHGRITVFNTNKIP